MEFAIYGGRVDNVFDVQVMVSYLKSFFDDSVLGDGARGSKRLGPLRVPASSSFRVRVTCWATLPATASVWHLSTSIAKDPPVAGFVCSRDHDLL